MYSPIPGLYPPDSGSPSPVIIIKKCYRNCQMFLKWGLSKVTFNRGSHCLKDWENLKEKIFFWIFFSSLLHYCCAGDAL
jgi:hypothetical protein